MSIIFSGLSSYLQANGGRNALILALCQGLFTCAISIDLTLTALAGYQLAPDKNLATLPFALITVAGAVSTLYASQLIHRLGRQRGFILGSLIGAAGGLISTVAVSYGNFWLFCAGTAGVGIYQAFAQYYRLAAADSVSAARKSQAISLVLTGGVIAAVLGPAVASWSQGLFTTGIFTGAYLMVFVLCVLSGLLLLLYRQMPTAPAAMPAEAALPARPQREVLRQPVFIASIGNNIIGAVTMMFVMTAAPLAAMASHHSVSDGASIIQWHLVGMYAPSLITGYLISRLGLPVMLFTGMLLNLFCVAVAMLSESLDAFYAALFFLGVGWNFMFVGGTTLLSNACRPAERARTQGLAEFIRYGATTVATLAAGPVLAYFGWQTVNIIIVPLIILAALMTAWWVWDEHAKQQDKPEASIES